MASYLQKLRRSSKQFIPTVVGGQENVSKTAESSKVQDAPQVQQPETSTAGPSGPIPTPPPQPTVTEPSDETGAEPVLDEEDQVFLERLAAIASEPEGDAPPLPTRPVQPTDNNGEKVVGRDAQTALMAGADQIALPMSPAEDNTDNSDKGKAKGGLDRKKSVMSYFSLDRFKKGDKGKEPLGKDKTDKLSDKERQTMADDLLAAAEASKAADQKKEDKELTDILDQLNLGAVNNRVFSFSKESEELLNKFTQVLKDIVNGAPTAYNDLEKLFTDYDAQLKKMYGGLPPFLQNMVKSLPAKLTATLGPELLAAGAEKPGFDMKAASAGTKGKKSKIPSIPTLKSLVTAQGAVATALRSIVNFLKFRFPMLATGTNLIMSLAVFRTSYYPLSLMCNTNISQSSSSSSGTATSAAAKHASKKTASPPNKASPRAPAPHPPSTRRTTPIPSLATSRNANLWGRRQRLNILRSRSLSRMIGNLLRAWRICRA